MAARYRSARAAATSRGVLVFLVDPASPGAEVEPLATTDRQSHGNLVLSGLRASDADVVGDARAATWCLERMLTGLCALQVGVAEEAVDLAAKYTSDRVQFGRPLSTFQGVALRAADAFIDTEAMPEGPGGAPADLAWIVEQAVRMKAAYVAEDAADTGLRHTLNLGHTIAHGLEGAGAFGLPHGEAVAIGLVAESRFGEARGITPPGTTVRLEALLARLHLPVTPPPGLDGAAIAAAIGSDKKRRGGRAVVVVPAPGGAELVEDVDPLELLTFLHAEVRR